MQIWRVPVSGDTGGGISVNLYSELYRARSNASEAGVGLYGPAKFKASLKSRAALG